MRFFVEESGNFTPTQGWSVVVAYMLSASQYSLALDVLRAFKVDAGEDPQLEYKRRAVPETTYSRFLEALAGIGGVMACVGTDARLNRDIESLRALQVQRIREGCSDERGLWLAQLVQDLSPQLFVELMCRLQLAWHALQRGTWYFARREPIALGEFIWRCDIKLSIDKPYGPGWAGMALDLSRRQALPKAPGADYRAMDALARREDLEGRVCYDASSLGLDQLQFVDSRDEPGIQIADWLAWGCRRCLMGGFEDAEITARLGRLLPRLSQRDYALYPMLFVRTGADEVPEPAATAMRELNRAAPVLR